MLKAAQSDPAGFIRGLDRAIIDEIQRAPDLLLAVKKTVDENYHPVRFLHTGSANVLTLPRIADSLAGRMDQSGRETVMRTGTPSDAVTRAT